MAYNATKPFLAFAHEKWSDDARQYAQDHAVIDYLVLQRMECTCLVLKTINKKYSE